MDETDKLIDCVAFITGVMRTHPQGPDINPDKEARRWIWFSGPEEETVWIVVLKDGTVAVEIFYDDDGDNSIQCCAIIGYCAVKNVPCVVNVDDLRLGVDVTLLNEDDEDEDEDDDIVVGEIKH